uniref:Uncharacterized protein n=1 Tax=Glossina palpalis gambiensis TaxID=67801 RepID=A0A1B0BXK0_9MUSC
MGKRFKELKAGPLTAANSVNDPKYSSKVLNRHIYLNDHLCPAAGELNVHVVSPEEEAPTDTNRHWHEKNPRRITTNLDKFLRHFTPKTMTLYKN